MHKVKVNSILNSKNGLNLYRGCQHNCIYCDSRSKCYNINHDFLDIEVKENAIELLNNELSKKRKKVMIGTGSMCDPYMPLEKELKLTRQMLELILKYGHGVSIITKSNLILDDLDLLTRINKNTKVVVQMTLTTYDENLCKIIEPNAPTTKERFETLKILNQNNIDTYVWLSPILPFINDSLDNLRGILNYCKEAKVKGIIFFGFGMTLREGNREYFYEMLDKFFPKLKRQYIKTYGNSYEILSPLHKYLKDYLFKFCENNNIICDNDKIFEEINKLYEEESYEKISLFIE